MCDWGSAVAAEDPVHRLAGGAGSSVGLGRSGNEQLVLGDDSDERYDSISTECSVEYVWTVGMPPRNGRARTVGGA